MISVFSLQLQQLNNNVLTFLLLKVEMKLSNVQRVALK